MVIFDKYIIQVLNTTKFILNNYQYYFAPEIKPLMQKKMQKNDRNLNNSWIKHLSKKVPGNFFQNRLIGENDDALCRIIRENSKILIAGAGIFYQKQKYAILIKFQKNKFVI